MSTSTNTAGTSVAAATEVPAVGAEVALAARTRGLRKTFRGTVAVDRLEARGQGIIGSVIPVTEHAGTE